MIALRVHDVVRDDRRDQLAAQRVLGQQVAEPLHDLRREVRAKVLLQVLRVRQRRPEQRVGQALLRVREQDGELGARHAATRAAALGHLLARGEELDLALEEPSASSDCIRSS